MTWTLGATSGLRNPLARDGYSRKRVRVGQDWLFLDGSEGEHYVTSRYEFTLRLAVKGSDYSSLVSAIEAAYGSAVTFVNHLSETYTVKVVDWSDALMADNMTHDVRLVLRETTA